MSARYAIYYAPAHDSPWWAFGACWLGRDEQRDLALEQPSLPQLAADSFARITAEPRRYGFHATLKAPFRLQAGVTADRLLERVDLLARTLDAVPVGVLEPVVMDGFVALAPPVDSTTAQAGLAHLAESCVTALDDLRAPLTNGELARRKPEALDTRGRELLDRFGYPHVMERFRFHMTLTGPVEAELAALLVAQVARPVEQLNIQAPLLLDRLCIFCQSEPEAAFRRLSDAMLRT